MSKHKRKQKKSKADIFFSSLNSHKRVKKILTPPLLNIGNIKLMSWIDMGIPSYLWACLISSNLNRDKSLRTLRKIAENSIDNHDDELNMFLCHQWIGMNNSDLFTKIFEFIKDDDEIKKVLSPLCYFENMPGHDRWLSLGLKPNEDSSKYLINTVRMCYDHQSIESTDVRWFFVLTMAAYGKIVFRREDEEFTKQIFYYPNRGDQRSVRPSIRAMENMIRQGLHEQEAALGSSWANYFWRECMEKTECIIKESDTPSAEDHKKTISQALNIADLLSLHYSKNTKESSNNTRVEVCFGIMLECIDTLINALSSPFLCMTKDGLLLLRHITESYITLKYLYKNNNIDMFKDFQNYGNGKLKLAFLKYESSETIPKFINISEIQKYATEEKSIELQEINIATWSGITIRKMAEESDLKDYYDTHYEFLSEFVHCSWAGIRSSVIENCLNPLHRFHRIPAPTPRFFVGIADEMITVVNHMLDIVDRMYPPFTERISAL